MIPFGHLSAHNPQPFIVIDLCDVVFNFDRSRDLYFFACFTSDTSCFTYRHNVLPNSLELHCTLVFLFSGTRSINAFDMFLYHVSIYIHMLLHRCERFVHDRDHFSGHTAAQLPNPIHPNSHPFGPAPGTFIASIQL